MKIPPIFGSGDPEDLLGFLRSLAEKSDDTRVVFKEIPVKPEWLALVNEFTEALDQANDLKRKAESLKRLFWSTVERETGHYQENMRFDGDKEILIVYATDDDKKKMNAEFFRKKDEPEEGGKPKKKK